MKKLKKLKKTSSNDFESKEFERFSSNDDSLDLIKDSKVFRLGNLFYVVVCCGLLGFSLFGLAYYWGFTTRNKDLGVKVNAYDLAEVHRKSPEHRTTRIFVVHESW
jgi:hypothetical protein